MCNALVSVIFATWQGFLPLVKSRGFLNDWRVISAVLRARKIFNKLSLHLYPWAESTLYDAADQGGFVLSSSVLSLVVVL